MRLAPTQARVVSAPGSHSVTVGDLARVAIRTVLMVFHAGRMGVRVSHW